MTTQCFRIQSGARSATCDISVLNDDTLYGPGIVAGKVRFLYDDGAIVTANLLCEKRFHSTMLTEFEGADEETCEYAELLSDEYAIEIGRRLDFGRDVPHVIMTQEDVEREAARCWAT